MLSLYLLSPHASGLEKFIAMFQLVATTCLQGIPINSYFLQEHVFVLTLTMNWSFQGPYTYENKHIRNVFHFK